LHPDHQQSEASTFASLSFSTRRSRKAERGERSRIRRRFSEAGFEQEAFDSPGPRADSFSVGVHRLATAPRALRSGERLFTFIR
jgi:hypothetical protein